MRNHLFTKTHFFEMKKFIAITCITLSTNASSTVLMYKSGNDLYNDLNSKDLFNNGVAMGYILGVFDSKLNSCITQQNIGWKQMYDAVKSYLADHPELGKFAAYSLVEHVLKQQFECSANAN